MRDWIVCAPIAALALGCVVRYAGAQSRPPPERAVTPTSASDTAGKVTRAAVVARLAAASEQQPAELTGLDLSGLDLSRVDFKRANLSDARLVRTNLSGAQMFGVTLNRAIARSWIRVLDLHGIRPWHPISAASVPLRQVRSYFRHQPWRGDPRWIRWQGACGHFEGLADLGAAVTP